MGRGRNGGNRRGRIVAGKVARNAPTPEDVSSDSFIEFDTDKEVLRFMNKNYGKGIKGKTHDIFESYTNQDGSYPYNEYLRFGKVIGSEPQGWSRWDEATKSIVVDPPSASDIRKAEETKQRKSKQLDAEVKLMDAYMSGENGILQHNLTVRRWVYGDFAEEMRNMPIGTRFTDKGYTSTGVLPKGFVEHQGSLNTQIKVPKGTRSAWVEKIVPDSNERELILKRGTTFEVTGRNGDMLELTVVGQS